MKILHKRNWYSVLLISVLLIILLVPTLAMSRTEELPSEEIPPRTYQVNEFGLTYGSGMYADSFETEPDLIYAQGKDGNFGYVFKTDLQGPVPSTPEEALAIMERRGTTWSIPLYLRDGRTVIGEFIMGGGEVIEMMPQVSE